MSIARHHAEWLSLIEVSGPFLSMPVLLRVFPQGLDPHDPEPGRLLREAYEEWEDDQAGLRPDPAIHRAWVRFVLTESLGLPDDVIAEGQRIPQTLKADMGEHGEILRPDIVIVNPSGGADAGKPRFLIQVLAAGQDLERPLPDRHWKASPASRMMELLHSTECRLGLLTNGEQWMLVDAPRGDTTGFASWYAHLWFEEPVTLRAFRSLLSANRFFAVADRDTLAALLAESAANQQEVTDQLGFQVRRAVEMLVQSLDRADQDHSRKLLVNISEERLYEAALTVMMRLVFLMSAEERGLLLLGDPLYDQHYAVSTLQAQLREAADQHGEDVLMRRLDAWSRLLATFRAVHAGIAHDRLRLLAYGGHLFDPDRFAFLEGRLPETTWRDRKAAPLPIDNRTVLHLLEALQFLQVRVPGGGPAEARRLSFRALGIEQIGHVYEGLLDHTAKRATEPILGLRGAKNKEPEVPLAELERLAKKGQEDLADFIHEETGRSKAAIANAISCELDAAEGNRFRVACGNDAKLWSRVRPFAGLIRDDTFGEPVVILPGGVYVTAGMGRRTSGTYYTPRSLTEPMVQYTLEPLVYDGPAAGQPRNSWRLHSAREILDLKVCDMATGSGAFLVQACRYLSERLLEAWEEAERTHPGVPGITPEGEPSRGSPVETVIPKDADERLAFARRIIAQRCLYGVDKNPLAVEMAKLSLWLLTLSKDKPFTFLDHCIRHGDSLVGVDLDQLKVFNLDRSGEQLGLFSHLLPKQIAEATGLRRQVEQTPPSTLDDVDAQEQLLARAENTTRRLNLAADLLIASDLQPGTAADRERLRERTAEKLLAYFKDGADLAPFERDARASLGGQPTFHWPVEFPEVLVERGGFDALVCNPPFMGGQKITGALGVPYRDYLVERLANGQRGSADLCTYFFLRAWRLLRDGGQFGFLATNTIAQGDTREVGLDQMFGAGAILPRAVSSRKWPGSANLEVAQVWARRGQWSDGYVLDDRPVSGITAFLTEPGEVTGKPYRLAANAGKSFQGSIVLGMGFVLTPNEAQALIKRNARNREVLFPYLNGEDLNSRPDQSPSRWVINFRDWPLDRKSAPTGYKGPVATDYEDCLAIVRRKVKPEREQNRYSANAREHWWLYERWRHELYATIAGMERVLVVTRVSKYLVAEFQHPGMVFTLDLFVFAFERWASFAMLQSNVHEAWAREYSSTHETRLRYAASDCFETLPLPAITPEVEVEGQRYYEQRKSLIRATSQGLTSTYNRFHDPDDTSKDISYLRDLHVEMDRGVAAAYDWNNLDLGHGFHETKQGLRFTISERARREVLARLLKLNHERYAEEIAAGLVDAKGKARKRVARPRVKRTAGPTSLHLFK